MFPTLNGLAAQRKPKKLLDQVRDVMRLRHYSIRTERCYCEWIVRFIRSTANATRVRWAKPRLAPLTRSSPTRSASRPVPSMSQLPHCSILTDLAREGNVAASTQNQALSALLFLYKEVLKEEIGWLEGVERAKKPKRLPMVLPRDEVHRVFTHLHGMPRLMAGLLYGSGLRLMARKSVAHVPGSARNGNVLCLCAEIRDRFRSIYWLFL